MNQYNNYHFTTAVNIVQRFQLRLLLHFCRMLFAKIKKPRKYVGSSKKGAFGPFQRGRREGQREQNDWKEEEGGGGGEGKGKNNIQLKTKGASA